MGLRMMDSLEVLRADGIGLNQVLCTTNERKSLKSLFSAWLSKPGNSPEISWALLPRSLMSLSLVSCSLSDESFPQKLSSLPLLQDLDLSENLISCLPECVKSLAQLRNLSVKSCKVLKSLTDIPSCISELYIDSCSSLERMTYQSFKSKYPSVSMDDDCGSLVMMQGQFKLEALENADVQMLRRFDLNVERTENVVMKMDHYSGAKKKMLSLQGLYEHGVFSTFIPGNKIPSSFISGKNTNAISFTISEPLNNVRGLSIAVVYAYSKFERPSRAYWCKQENIVHNRTKDLKWIHSPSIFARPEGKGTEEITWLSYWKFGNLLEDGDKISIIVSLSRLKVKEIGIELVCEEQDLSNDPSNCEVASEVPLFSNDNVPGDISQRGKVYKIGR